MNNLNQEKLIQISADWIRERSPDPGVKTMEILAGTPLFDTGILDSLGLIDLLTFLENATGNQIDLLELDEVEMTTLKGLCRAACNSDHQVGD